MNILLIGCGHMGGAMLAGWLDHPRIARIDVVDPAATAPADSRVTMHRALNALAGRDFDACVLAVKPQVMDAMLATLAPVLPQGIPVLSIAAGVTLATLGRFMGADRPLLRAMPNTPGAIGAGITGFITNKKITKKQIDEAVFLFSTLGDVVALDNESQIDAVTAISGSGPAYVFALAEALEKAGIECGLAPDMAARLARATVQGAGALLAARASESPESLRRAVTSPGGTTAAALKVLHENRALDRLMNDAVHAALARARELAQTP
ncbi:MAG: pyrroline-5-carboxylate reductase [Alphaproteobacteria bacterium]|nr:pyrroline-5-carboxylate reductase [Alphaproteobacteria bacterium]USO07979.1 MAG: pyrroline-5-carboxylate reductase [Rhodospirillales bacterium]